jgi:hypothetical protein
VKFVEKSDAEEGVEKPETSGYDEDEFESQENPSQQMVPKISEKTVKPYFKEMRLLLMVKKVPRSHML